MPCSKYIPPDGKEFLMINALRASVTVLVLQIIVGWFAMVYSDGDIRTIIVFVAIAAFCVLFTTFFIRFDRISERVWSSSVAVVILFMIAFDVDIVILFMWTMFTSLVGAASFDISTASEEEMERRKDTALLPILIALMPGGIGLIYVALVYNLLHLKKAAENMR